MVDFLGLQIVLYDALKANAALAAQVSGVYDFVPDATEYPYVLFDTLNATRDPNVSLSSTLVVEQIVKAYTNDAETGKGWAQLRGIVSTIVEQFTNAVCFVNGSRRVQTVVSRVNMTREAGTVRSGSVSVMIYFA